ncbi:MAG TPA: toll/interleukin-1 receptor domain-containing protein [Thermoanaerobaculia bacterium]|nr:toll/interleukin-1 receptor domain-containing protein [Thermoanaerobaculia bacterium]
MSVRRLMVFLCHASQDKEEVCALCKRLEVDGFDPWLDKKKLLPGQKWSDEILKAVSRSDVVVVCLSRHSSRPGFIQKEIREALDAADKQPPGATFIIPARLEPCDIPERLAEWHYVDLFEPDGYEKLVQAIRKRAASDQRLLFATWPDAPLKISDFSASLIEEIERITDATTSVLLRLNEYPARASANAGFASDVNQQIAAIPLDDALDVDITCIDETDRYFVHSSCPAIISRTHESVWTGSQGQEFSRWFSQNVSELQRGMLTWTDKVSDDPNLPWSRYKRKTIVAFKRIAVAENVDWTIAVEGHEVAKRRNQRADGAVIPRR